MLSALDRWFSISARGSTFFREIIAGLTVFGSMAYIVAVNPAILSAAGLDRHDMVMTTIAGAVAGTLLMALWARLPIALAPAMSSNVLFSQVVVQQAHVNPRTAFTVVFFSGILFTSLSLSSIRQKIIQGFPPTIILGIQVALGAFIARIGLITGGIATPSPDGLSFGSLHDPRVILSLAGIILCAILIVLRVPAGLFLTLISITFAGLFITKNHAYITTVPNSMMDWPHYPSHLFLPFDFQGFFSHLGLLVPITLYFLISDFFDASSTLIGITNRANLADSSDKLTLDYRAFASDGTASIIGACLGTCTVSAYIESLVGVEAGGRTGLSSCVVAILFAITAIFWPIITAVPAVATAPVLVIVGLSMLNNLHLISPKNSDALPPLTMLLIASVTGNFMLSLSCGLFLYTGLAIALREFKKLSIIVISLDLLFLFYMFLQMHIEH
ncbi:NCS2 family permease [Swingsia samuiensis]|uniref:NCS2 family permease n=1 Tax=Swingsia samuiensis TaxID=1293412 RepID=A0A4Y6UFN4_9PROT|nr:NCS2 family permease [Swingsia samuiensis]QDH16363.1 NCS2 family permease [Swingsia samuiensis]